MLLQEATMAGRRVAMAVSGKSAQRCPLTVTSAVTFVTPADVFDVELGSQGIQAVLSGLCLLNHLVLCHMIIFSALNLNHLQYSKAKSSSAF